VPRPSGLSAVAGRCHSVRLLTRRGRESVEGGGAPSTRQSQERRARRRERSTTRARADGERRGSQIGFSARNATEWGQLTSALTVFDMVETRASHVQRARTVQRQLASTSQRGRTIPDPGWRSRTGSGLRAAQARQGARPTLDALESMAGGREALDPALVTRPTRGRSVRGHRRWVTTTSLIVEPGARSAA
jgi:hypothetical protein